MSRLAFYFFLVIFYSSLVLNAQKTEGVMKFQNNPVVINGDLSEFTNLPRFCDSESHLFYEFRNDGENIYFLFFSTDRLTNIKMLNSGLNILVDSVKINKKSDNLIILTIPHERPIRERLENNVGMEAKSEDMLQEMGKGITVVPVVAISGFEAYSDNNSFCSSVYFVRDSLIRGELIIPIKSLFAENSVGFGKTRMLNFKILINAIDLPPNLGDESNNMRPDRPAQSENDMLENANLSSLSGNSNQSRPSGGFEKPREGMHPPLNESNSEYLNFGDIKIRGILRLSEFIDF